jgi:hypothetical protein
VADEIMEATKTEFGDARATGGQLTEWEAGIFAQSRALVDWNMRNKVGTIYADRWCVYLQ